MNETLGQALVDEREDVGVLRAKGMVREAEMLERVLARIERAAAPFVDWLTEREAVLRSSHNVGWHRERFPQLQAQGLARFNPDRPRERQYLRCAVPQRANTSAAREAGERGDRVAV